ncbi:3-phenylpropionate/cinnamic acid dioxygenase small subunit [Nocardioides sp. J9]|uniref:aromatic-ring-hydroxylating dioxygenase subunit beta n=1 Tax=Nocardioides sp. J9 TaxID=935844 RepID=UPI0011A8D389|nr:aromatic-ring-hydroxylating dioxygenase subunit beta [Nocardioides sp. J9]TWG91676.1 3-phenylpropionate/cinnamic acid dioxygenase small subunit [Nocardioides sp. J9]
MSEINLLELPPRPDTAGELVAVPDGWEAREVEQFLYKEARLADENDYDGWEALWTDDALYWVPVDGEGDHPRAKVSIIFDNRSRIATRMKQVKTGKRYAQAPPSNLRRIIGNVEILGGRASAGGDVDLEVGANFIAFESRDRGNTIWGGRTTYRLRKVDGEIKLAYKKVVLADNEHAVPTLAFLI